MLGRLVRWILAILKGIFSGDGQAPFPTVTVGGTAMSSGGKKKAFIVGLNNCGIPGSELNGCINDAEAMWKLLTEKFGFAPDDVRVVTDERATKDAILQRLKWLIEGSSPGDELVFHYSGH